MASRYSRTFVRIAATVTLVFSVAILSWLVPAGYKAFKREDWRLLGAIGLIAIIPLLWAGESIRAWRYKGNGISSVSAVWGLAGAFGSVFCLVALFQQFSLSKAIWSFVFLVITFLGALLGRAKKDAG